MKIHLIRHGKTDLNEQKLTQGREIDESLTDEGRKKVFNLATNILPKDFDLTFCSPMKRAVETAQIIFEALGTPYRIREELIERGFGEQSGKTWEQINKDTGLDLKSADRNLKYDYRPYGGDWVEGVKKRIIHFNVGVKLYFSDFKLLYVTHSGIIRLHYGIYGPEKLAPKMKHSMLHEFNI